MSLVPQSTLVGTASSLPRSAQTGAEMGPETALPPGFG